MLIEIFFDRFIFILLTIDRWTKVSNFHLHRCFISRFYLLSFIFYLNECRLDVQLTNCPSKRNECLTPSKPAGTKTLIDGIVYGDITTFYDDIYLQLEDFPSNFFSSSDNPSTKLFYPSNLISTKQMSTNEHLSIQFSSTNESKTIETSSSSSQKSSSTSSISSSDHFSTLTRAGKHPIIVFHSISLKYLVFILQSILKPKVWKVVFKQLEFEPTKVNS